MTRRDRLSRLIDTARRWIGRGRPIAEPADAWREPCASCDETTAIGSPLCSDRFEAKGPAGEIVILCSFCRARMRGSGRKRPLTDAEVRAIVANGTAAAYVWGNRGGPI